MLADVTGETLALVLVRVEVLLALSPDERAPIDAGELVREHGEGVRPVPEVLGYELTHREERGQSSRKPCARGR